MKKWIAIILVALMALSVVACAGKKDDAKKDDDKNAVTDQKTDQKQEGQSPAASEGEHASVFVTAEPEHASGFATAEPEYEPAPVPAPEPADPIVGKWLLTDTSEGKPPFEMAYEFAADGMIYTDYEESAAYTVNGDRITVENETYTISFDGDTMTFTDDAGVWLQFTRYDAYEPEPAPAPVPVADNSIVGDWLYDIESELAGMDEEERELMDQMGITPESYHVVYSFRADGTGRADMTMLGDSETIEFTYIAENGLISMTPVNQYVGDTITGTYAVNGDTLVITTDEGEAIAFKRQ